ncbi:hypothetical protein G6F62_015819 [Rhizopus arrhizus]|nr:hypothetical protein G6F62_015819 [Rhizopus arrhizus]
MADQQQLGAVDALFFVQRAAHGVQRVVGALQAQRLFTHHVQDRPLQFTAHAVRGRRIDDAALHAVQHAGRAAAGMVGIAA